MSNKTLMILGASILQLPAIQKAKSLGLNVVVVDMNPNAVGFDVPRITKEVISTIDIPAVLKCAKRHKIDGIMTLASDMPMRAVAKVSQELGLIGISEQTAINATDKACMRRALEKNNVPIPKFFAVSNREEYEHAVSQFDGPFIVKPADNSGSRGVTKISYPTKSEILLEAYNYSKSFSRNGNIVVEEFMIGPEVSVETLTVDGRFYLIQITDKITTGAPHFVEMGHTQPSLLDEVTKQKIAIVAKKANEAIGITNGPSHTEIIVTKDGPKVVELGARLGGDCITTHLVPLSTGVDMVECCIKIALGEKPNLENKHNKGAAIRFFKTEKGTIKSISGVEEVQKRPGIKQLSIVRGIGECIDEINSSTARVGFIISQADNALAAAECCESALEQVVFCMEN